MGIIELEGMLFHAFHGHFEVEQLVGNEFRVDIKIKTDCLKASETDNIEDTLNYQSVYRIIQKEMAVNSRLLENVAKRILDSLYCKFPQIKKVKLKISKMAPALGGDVEKVSVTLKR